MSYARRAARAVQVLAPEEQVKLLDVTGQHVSGFRDHVIYSVALGTALRESEIAWLNVGDVVAGGLSEARAEITLKRFAQKGGKKTGSKSPVRKRDLVDVSQTVWVPRNTRRKLVKFIAWKKRQGEDVGREAPLFLSNEGTRIAPRTMRRNFVVWQERAGFQRRYTFHHLRHTCLSRLYGSTKDLMLVRAQARHKHVTTTEIYAHVADQDVRRAVEELPT
jgi:integrase/recombinase XerC